MNYINLENFKSVNAQHASVAVSEKYSFIPTTRVLNVLSDHGWFPVKASEARTRVEGKQGFQKHMLRLRNTTQKFEVGDYLPEIVLINSHCGASSFKLMAGIFRLICSNGAIVGDTFESFSIRHMGYTDQAVSDAIDGIVEVLPATHTQIEGWRRLELDPPEIKAYAESVVELLDTNAEIRPDTMIQARRYADNGNDLWTVFNRAQENIIRGGMRQRNESGRVSRRRAVTSIDKNVSLNRALWSLTEKMAALKTGAMN